MCRGIHQERNNQGGSCGEEVVSSKATSRLVCCELCGSRASLYCQADDAFLCQKCDKWVHGANFLAQRHVRCMLCNTCQNLTQRYLIGASTEVLLPTIVSWRERRQCNSNLEKKSSGSLKMPFLFLWFCFSFSPFLSLFSSLFFSFLVLLKDFFSWDLLMERTQNCHLKGFGCIWELLQVGDKIDQSIFLLYAPPYISKKIQRP